MAESDITRAKLFALTVPGLLTAATVTLGTTAIWPVAILTGGATVGAFVWARRMVANERADEALREAAKGGQQDVSEDDA